MRSFIATSRLLRVALASGTMLLAVVARPAHAQAPTPIERIAIAVGRSLPIDLPGAVTQVTIATDAIADIVVLTERSVVLNAKAVGETDILLSGPTIGRRHLRVAVYTATDRRQIALGVKFAEVRRESLLELGVNARFDATSGNGSAGTGVLSPGVGGAAPVATSGLGRFVSGLATFGTKDLLAYIDAQQQQGKARSLAEPTLMAGNREDASFLAGGELPIPIAQPGQNGQGTVITIAFRPFGVQLKFNAEVLSDSLIKLRVEPEVSSLDFANALLIAGFRVPAIRTRKVVTTLDVRPGQSLIISGLFSEERENVKTGVPGLMNIPILGTLFSSSRWQKSESELLVIVSPVLIDPNNPPEANRMQFLPDSTKPAIEAVKKRLPPS